MYQLGSSVSNRIQELKIGAGGAITYPSIAQNEWEEVLTKARSVVSKLIDY